MFEQCTVVCGCALTFALMHFDLREVHYVVHLTIEIFFGVWGVGRGTVIAI